MTEVSATRLISEHISAQAELGLFLSKKQSGTKPCSPDLAPLDY